MKKHHFPLILKSLAFLLIFFGLLFHISNVLRPEVTIQGNNERLGMLGIYAEPKNTIDVLYFGSSDATAFWSPFTAYEQAGFTSYTYGKSMMRASMFEDMLDEALKTQSPSLVIVSLRTILQSGDTVEEAALRSVTDSLPYSTLNRWKMIFRNHGKIILSDNAIENEGTGEPTKGLFAEIPFYFDIMKYHDNWQHIWEGSYHYRGLGRFSSSTKGYFVGTGCVPQKRDPSVSQISKSMELSEGAENALHALMQRADRDGFNILFVMPPYCESTEDRMHFNRAAALISEAGHTVIDFNDFWNEIGMDAENDFYDPGHTNILGARKFTAFLTDYLSTHYDLPDRRTDPRYAAWQEGLENWHKTVSDALRNTISKRKFVFEDDSFAGKE